MTVDKTRVHHYDPRMKHQSTKYCHNTLSTEKKASAGKFIVKDFLTADDVICMDFLEPGTSVLFRALHYGMQNFETMIRQSFETSEGNCDNASLHTSQDTQEANGSLVLSHQPCSPDLAPYIFSQN